jgi:hypothetical protein
MPMPADADAPRWPCPTPSPEASFFWSRIVTQVPKVLKPQIVRLRLNQQIVRLGLAMPGSRPGTSRCWGVTRIPHPATANIPPPIPARFQILNGSPHTTPASAPLSRIDVASAAKQSRLTRLRSNSTTTVAAPQSVTLLIKAHSRRRYSVVSQLLHHSIPNPILLLLWRAAGRGFTRLGGDEAPACLFRCTGW